MTSERYERHDRDILTDAKWARLAPLLPPQKPRTGAPWRDLPERYGPWHTVASCFYRWVATGLWDRVLAALQQQGDAAGTLDWGTHFVDGTTVRAHRHAAGAQRGALRARSWPPSGRPSAAAGAASAPSSP